MTFYNLETLIASAKMQISKESDYSQQELDAISVRLQHCYERYFCETGLDCFAFADDYLTVWRV